MLALLVFNSLTDADTDAFPPLSLRVQRDLLKPSPPHHHHLSMFTCGQLVPQVNLCSNHTARLQVHPRRNMAEAVFSRSG